MGDHWVTQQLSKKERAQFVGHLLTDLEALEKMLREGMIEDDIIRIGAEQEFCLVTDHWRPATNAEALLKAIDDPHFTTELATYNLEINLDPVEVSSDCFSTVSSQLKTLLKKASAVAEKQHTKILLTGILPTISKNELEFKYMTPQPRYWALNERLKSLRGSDFQLHIKGVDDLDINHNSVLFEACNTSFQMHLQIRPDDFISSYNWAQTISGPVLGISTNSPLLLGRELWAETRIALFQQSIDTRYSSYALKDQQPRVSFGSRWETGSIAEIFKNDIAEHKIVLSKEIEKNSLEELKKGNIPKLAALNLHNGTIYKWNRPCYGVGNGVPHVRIENRYIAAGPTTEDEMATFAFWVGLMLGRPKEFDNMPSQMDFKDVKANFIRAARTGRYAVMEWMGEQYSVKRLILEKLLPIAKKGLEIAGLSISEIDSYLNIIEQRALQTTPSQWMVKNFRTLRKHMKKDDALRVLTKTIHQNQITELPCHEWESLSEETAILKTASMVGHIMNTQLFTVTAHDLASLATKVMLWKDIHHVPVVDEQGHLEGLLTWTHMQRYQKGAAPESESTVVDIMTFDVLAVTPNTSIEEAISLMKTNEYGCLPVVQDAELIGIITIKDVLEFDNQ
ncbi:CBS domain-containing protein [Flavobacteriaceae bacterium TK19130]|nr:CBS domain-containing protein [Thermobacterium salinum]